MAANEFYQFDAMGRVQEGRQCTPATCGLSSYPVQTGYDLMGNEINLWDSSLARYYAYDAVGRLSNTSASSNVSPPALTATGPGSQPLINISAHSPFGGLTNAALGNGLAESRSYNVRGWLGSIGVGSVYSLSMGYAGNGNVAGAIDSENGNWTYGYDTLNRLQTAVIGGQTFTYSPDAYGNMTCTAPQGMACTPLGLNISPATNQITTSGYSYDAAGNLLTDNTHHYVYDAENHLICVWGTDGTCTSASAMLYLYDAQGQRVGKQQADTLEDYVYDPQGHIISVHDGSANLLRSELYSPGARHVATWAPTNPPYWDPYPGGLFYNHADWLGTERVRTTSTGAIYETCTDTPYGMNLTCTDSSQTDISPMHFTGKQRDYESNLDYFGARYLGGGNNLGRFMSPDPGPWRFLNPQSYNAYAYALNNPLRFADEEGETAKDRVNAATAELGVPYVSGGLDAGGFDCRGLVYYAFAKDPDNTLDLDPHHFNSKLKLGGGVAYEQNIFQTKGDYSTDLSTAQPGDAIFFGDPGADTASHVGLVVDNKDGVIWFIHAAGSPDNPYWVMKASISIKNPAFGSKRAVGLGRPRTPRVTTVRQDTPQSPQCLWQQMLHLFFFWGTSEESEPNGNPKR